jgi:hypothetical protein
VESDDPKQPRLRLTVSANIVIELGFERPQVRFDKARVGKPVVQRAPIIGKLASGITLSEVTSDLKGLKVKLVPAKARPGAAAQELELTFTPEKVGTVNGAVRVKTSHQRFPELRLRVYGKVLGDLEVQPDRLVLSPGDAKDKVYTLVVKSEQGGREGLEVVDTNGFMEAKLLPEEPGKSWRVELRRSKKGQEAADAFSTKVKISVKGDAKSAAEVRVYFRGAGGSRRAFSKGLGAAAKMKKGKKPMMRGVRAATPVKTN